MSQWGWQMRQDLQEMSPSGQMQAQVDCPRASSRAHRATLRQLNPTHSICLTSIGVCMFRCLAIKSTILLLWKQFENKKAKGISETQRTQKRYTEMKGGNKHMKNMNLSVESWVKDRDPEAGNVACQALFCSHPLWGLSLMFAFTFYLTLQGRRASEHCTVITDGDNPMDFPEDINIMGNEVFTSQPMLPM